MTQFRFCLVILATLVALGSCLPADTRPEPGSLATVVVADEAIPAGFATSDGWNVTFDEFLISLGEVDLEGDDCNPYAESDYLRILDLRQPEAQRLNLMYALGTCEFSFLVEDPSRDAVLGSGVDEADKDMMRTAGSDAFVEDRGVALHVAGSAVKDDERYGFAWSFRHNLQYTDCGTIEFDSGASDRVEIHVRGRVLFQQNLDDDSSLQFHEFASADLDGDHDITLEELNGVSLNEGDHYGTLAERLYLGLVPEVPRFRNTGACSAAPPDEDF
jgi:hypothetical protein